MSKPWGGVGAWALDSERAEEEERESAPPAGPTGGDPTSFPSLKEAAAAAGKPKKKNKGTTLSLSDFTTGNYGVAGSGSGSGSGNRNRQEPKGLTPDELMMLPTGPREHGPDERGGLGGGFRNYGRDGGGGGGGGSRYDRDDENNNRRRGLQGSRTPEFDQPSRADEVDNWGMNKRAPAPPAESNRRSNNERYNNLGASRADETNDWNRDKKPPPPSRYSNLSSSAGSSDSERWVRGQPLHDAGSTGDRPRLVLDPPKKDVSSNTGMVEAARTRPSPFGVARPREEVLSEKGLDWRKMESEIDKKGTSRPSSAQSTRPGSGQSSRAGSPGASSEVSEGGSVVQPRARPRVNPFGEAKPREVVLKEQGRDWRKMDLELEHRGIDRAETTEERMLKDEINLLKEKVKLTEEKTSDGSAQGSAEDVMTLCEMIAHKEDELEHLVLELDDRVRFGPKSTDVRPGSGAGRPGSGAGRPGSGAGRVTSFPQAGIPEEPQVTDAAERPHSRGGMGEHWSRPEERGGFQGSRDRGFGNRSSERPMPTKRW